MGAILLSEGAGTGITKVVSDIFSIAGSALSFVTSNPILLLYFGAGIVGIGIGVIRKLKH